MGHRASLNRKRSQSKARSAIEVIAAPMMSRAAKVLLFLRSTRQGATKLLIGQKIAYERGLGIGGWLLPTTPIKSWSLGVLLAWSLSAAAWVWPPSLAAQEAPPAPPAAQPDQSPPETESLDPGAQETGPQETGPQESATAAPGSDETEAVDSETTTGFRWRFAERDSWLVTATQTIKETVPIGGQSVELPMTVTLEAQWLIESIDEQGLATIKQTIKRLRFEAKSPFLGEILADTQGAPTAAGMTGLEQTLRAAIGQSWNFRLSPLGQISDVSLPGSAPASRVGDLSERLTAPDHLQQIVTPSLIFGEASVKAGETWTVADALPVPVMGSRRLSLVFTYVGSVAAGSQTLEKFEVRSESPIDPSGNAPAESTRNTGADASFTLRETKVSGTALFDPALGHLTSISLRSTLAVAAEVEGMVTDSKVIIDSNLSLRRE